MEDEDGVEGAELGADDAEVEPDDDGVEDDAELEDEEGGDLLLEGEAGAVGVEAGVPALFDVLEALGVAGHGDGDVRSGTSPGVGRGRSRFALVGDVAVLDARDGALDVLLGAVAILQLNIALRPKIEQENQHHSRKNNSRAPGIAGPAARHADAGVGSDLAVSRVEEVDEGGGDDDAGAEVAGEEVDVEGDAEAGDALGDDGEEGGAGGDDHDDEEGGDAGAELAVVVVGGGGDGADDVAGVGGGEVDVGGVEVCGAEVVGRHCVWWFGGFDRCGGFFFFFFLSAFLPFLRSFLLGRVYLFSHFILRWNVGI